MASFELKVGNTPTITPGDVLLVSIRANLRLPLCFDPNSAQDATGPWWQTTDGGVAVANDRESPPLTPPIGHVGSNPVIPP